MTSAVEVIEDTARAQALLHPARLLLLEQMDEPASATVLARRLDQPRQRVNYHLRELEAHRLIELVEERRKGSVSERVYRRTGRGYAIAGSTLGGIATAPEDHQDRFSTECQIALAARAISELARLRAGAQAEGKRLATLSVDVDVRFASAAARNAFGEELTQLIADLVHRYHDDAAPDGRAFRFYVGAYPKPKET